MQTNFTVEMNCSENEDGAAAAAAAARSCGTFWLFEYRHLTHSESDLKGRRDKKEVNLPRSAPASVRFAILRSFIGFIRIFRCFYEALRSLIVLQTLACVKSVATVGARSPNIT